MPPEVFGGSHGSKSLFRGRKLTQYDDVRAELVHYIEVKPAPANNAVQHGRSLNQLKEALEDADPEVQKTALEELEAYHGILTMYKTNKGKGGPEGGGQGGGKTGWPQGGGGYPPR